MTFGFPLRTFFLLLLCHVFVDFFLGIWPLYKTMAQIDIAEAGFIAGLAGFIGEIMQLGFGYFCDRGHRKRILIFGVIMASSITWITFISHSFLIFGLMLALMIGSGSFHPAAVGTIGGLSPNFKGRLILWFTAFGGIGMAVSQVIFSKLVDSSGHAAWLLLPLALLFFVLLTHKMPEINTGAKLNIKDIATQLSAHRKPLSLLYFSQVTSYAVNLTLFFMLPDILKMKEGHTWLLYGGGHMCVVFGSIISMILVGFLCHKWGFRRIIVSSLFSSFILIAIFLFAPATSLALTSILLILLGGFLCVVNPMIVAWGNHLAPHSPSTISALLMGFAWCFSNLGPILAGIMARSFKTVPFINSMAMISLLLLTSMFLVSFIPAKAAAKEPISN